MDQAVITDAIILTGGTASRLGGIDKAALEIGGMTLLDHAIAAAGACRTIVAVGPDDGRRPDIGWTREDPPGGGPVAALAAGIAALGEDADLVLALACDVPRARQVVPALIDAAASTDADGAWAVDAGGRVQPLLAVYRRDSLAEALVRVRTVAGASMRALTANASMIEVPAGEAAHDADTWDDVRVLRKESS